MKLSRTVSIVCIVFVVFLLVGFFYRNTFLQWGFAQIQKRVHENYELQISASSLLFSGFGKIHFQNICAVPDSADTLLVIKTAEVNLSLKSLLSGKIAFDEILIDSASVTVYRSTEKNNMPLLSRKKSSGKKIISPSLNYYERTKLLSQKFFNILSTSFSVTNATIQYSDSTLSENIFIPALTYDDQKLNGTFINRNENDSLFISGDIVEKNKSFQISLRQSNNGKSFLPLLNEKGKLQCSFKSVNAAIKIENTHNEFQISLNASSENFTVNHWRIADDAVTFPHIHFNSKILVTPSSVSLDSLSLLRLQETQVNLFASYFTGQDTIISLRIQMPETTADTFFNSLPIGMFNTLKGISCTGTLAYNLQFSINTRQPDSLFFYSSLTRKNFRVNHFGAEIFSRINEPFTYQAYDRLTPVRQIEIGTSNPSFTPLAHINPYLVHAVLQSEDPSFMQHRGFLSESFRESIAKNYKEKRFARGGSTITMQLVKNIFLKRSKTISRKAEEALITYLIENLQLVPKERMLEIYLNAIEWGPNVYGIGEAARFYFNKRPAELTLQESVFLAGIIPAPKYFKYQFDKQGKLKPYLSNYFKVITTRMVTRGWLNPQDTVALNPDVKTSWSLTLLCNS